MFHTTVEYLHILFIKNHFYKNPIHNPKEDYELSGSI